MTRVRDDPEKELPSVVRVAAQATLLLIKKYYGVTGLRYLYFDLVLQNMPLHIVLHLVCAACIIYLLLID